MSLLTQELIKKAIKDEIIIFEPAISDEQISVASVDLRLGNEFRVFSGSRKTVDIKDETDYRDLTKEVIADRLVIGPLETVLGITVEKITLPGNICGWLEGRSRFARLGLLIHISAGFIQPGVSNRQVLEITNLSPNDLMLYAGEKLCQIVFQKCEGSVIYRGKFMNQ